MVNNVVLNMLKKCPYFCVYLNEYICSGYAGAETGQPAAGEDHRRRRDISSSMLATYATSSLVSCKTYQRRREIVHDENPYRRNLASGLLRFLLTKRDH